MSTPEELLCSRKWRLVQSLWMILGWVPLALTAWVGYLIIGIRAKNWKWLVLAGAFLGWLFVYGAWFETFPTVAKGESMPAEYATSNGWWAACGLLVWLGNAIGLQLWINRKWLLWRAHHHKNVPWYATATQGNRVTQPVGPSGPATIDDAFNGLSSVVTSPPRSIAPGGPVMPSIPPSPMDLHKPPATAAGQFAQLNLNGATREQLAALPGIDAWSADQIVTARERLGGFRDVSELVSFAGVKPHIFADIQTRVTIDTPAPARPQPQTNSMPPGGRRLDF